MSWGEFRILNVFLCIYGAMYDAFSRIDGNLVGAATGRDGDDLRIEKDEWMKGYKSVTGYGFVGLSSSLLKDEEAAEAVLNKVRT